MRQLYEEIPRPPIEAAQFCPRDKAGMTREELTAHARELGLEEADHLRFYFISTKIPGTETLTCLPGGQLGLHEVQMGDWVIYSANGKPVMAVPDTVFKAHYQPVVQSD